MPYSQAARRGSAVSSMSASARFASVTERWRSSDQKWQDEARCSSAA
jgi:hypothetical protein